MSMKNLAFLLTPLLILASVGPSPGQFGNNVAYGSRDFEVPRSWQYYSSARRDQTWPRYQPDTEKFFRNLDYFERRENKPANLGKFPYSSHYEGLQAGTETLKDIYRQDRNQEDSAGEQIYDQDGKASVGRAKLLAKIISGKAAERPSYGSEEQTCPTSTSRPVSISSTSFPTTTEPTRRTSTIGLPDSTPIPFATSKLPYPPPPTTCRPPTTPSTTSEIQPSKCHKKSKLSPKTARIIMEIIMATKQQTLLLLLTLNDLEMEVLSNSPDDWPMEDLGQDQPKKKRKPSEELLRPASWAHSQGFFFGIRPASHSESASDKALARAEERKLERLVWREHQQELMDNKHINPMKSYWRP